MPNLDLDRVRGLIGENLLADASSLGDAVFIVQRQGIHAVLQSLRDDESLRFDMLIDLAAVDRLGLPNSPERFEVIYILYSMWNGWRLRLKVPVPESDLTIDSIDDLYKAANWSEREVWDLFGIRFNGHPNLKRILCHHEFVGHALRKDYDRRRGQWCSTVETLEDELELKHEAERQQSREAGEAEPS